MTVQLDLTELDDCDTAGGGSWSVFNISGTMGGLQDVDATSEDMTVNIEGTQCYGFDCDKESGGYEYPLGAATDMREMTVYIWVSIPTALGGLENLVPGAGQSGLFISAYDGTNRGYWHVAGKDTWDGAWKCFKAFLGDPVDSGVQPDASAITYIGFGVDHPNAKSKASCNIFFDAIRYGTGDKGISVYGGSEGSELDFDDIVTGDAAGAYGIIKDVGGVYYVNGAIKFGHDSQDCYFKDIGKLIVFEDTPHTSGELYKFEIIEGASQVTQFQLGELSGTQGIQGCFVTAAGPQDWDLLCSGEAVERFRLYGNTLGRTKWVDLSYSGEKDILSCSFQDQASGEIYPSGIDFSYSNIINPTNVGMVFENDTDALPDNCNFIACPVGIEFRWSGEYSFNNLVFTNCANDVWNNSGGAITINATGTSNPSSYSGENVTIVNTKYHRVTNVIQGSEVTYVSGEGESAIELAHEESVGADGISQYDYSYSGDHDVDILIMHLNYEPWQQTVTLSSTDTILPVSQVQDRIYSNP